MVFVSGQVPTAAELNAITTDIFTQPSGGTGAWTTYTPTLTQSGAVTKTVTYAAYMKIGRLVIGNVALSVTGTGSAANIVLIGLPQTSGTSALISPGSGYIFDSSASALYKGVVTLNSTTTVSLAATTTTTGGRLGTEAFTAALASGDLIAVSFMYEAAS